MLNIIILAAGQGKRMKSQLPKVLHKIGNKSLLEHVVNAAQQLKPANIYVVYGHQGEQVHAALQHLPVQWIEQREQLGTGHAVMQVLPHLDPKGQVLILVGDAPMITANTLNKLMTKVADNSIGMVTAVLENPDGLGRILRDENNQVIGIAEQKDATPSQRKIKEINTGIILASVEKLQQWLPKVKNHNAQSEYYLPDIIPMAFAEKIIINTVICEDVCEIQGVNDRAQLAMLERYYQQQRAKELMLQGITLRDPNRFDLRGELQAAQDVTIDINVVIEGKVSIGANCYIGPNVILRDVSIGNDTEIKANSIVEQAEIADGCIVGPFARIRPETKLASNSHVGNFVELKKTSVGKKTKINHLSYIGDAVIGADVNIGAGTITCNYDGVNKHQTIIEDNVFVGSDTQLVAPITIGKGAVIGAGATVTKDVAAETLTITHRLEQRTMEKKVKGER